MLAANGQDEDAALLLGVNFRHSLTTLPQLARMRQQCERDLGRRLGRTSLHRLMRAGAALSLRQAIDLIADDGLGSPVDTDAADEGGVLSKREWEVAQLVADGCSNKAIAASLVISTRTAEGHVRRILGKLDLTSRAQVAAWATEQRALRRSFRALPTGTAVDSG